MDLQYKLNFFHGLVAFWAYYNGMDDENVTNF